MSLQLTVEQLIEAANGLVKEDRQRLIRALTLQGSERKRHVTELRGLGKDIWQRRDAQEYVDPERDSWGS